MTTREVWLHGWPRMQDAEGNKGDTVLMGTGVYCVGCGFFFGITTVVFDEDWEAPLTDPEWPFEEANCPLPIHASLRRLNENPSGIFYPEWPRGKPRPLP